MEEIKVNLISDHVYGRFDHLEEVSLRATNLCKAPIKAMINNFYGSREICTQTAGTQIFYDTGRLLIGRQQMTKPVEEQPFK